MIGGYNGSQLSSCEELRGDAWGPLASLNTARQLFGAASLDDKIYVAGGHGGGGGYLSSVEVFDGVRWTLLGSSLAQTRYYCAATALNGTLVVLGGRTTVEQFSPAAGTWSAKSIPAMRTARRNFLAVVSF